MLYHVQLTVLTFSLTLILLKMMQYHTQVSFILQRVAQG